MGVETATPADIPRIVALLLRIENGMRPNWQKGKVSPFPPLVPKDAKVSLFNIISDASGVCFSTPNAMIAGTVAPNRINFTVLEAYELFWQSTGRDGNKVLRAFEDWALRMGADRIVVSSIHALDGADASELRRKMFERQGYELSESVWEKRTDG